MNNEILFINVPTTSNKKISKILQNSLNFVYYAFGVNVTDQILKETSFLNQSDSVIVINNISLPVVTGSDIKKMNEQNTLLKLLINLLKTTFFVHAITNKQGKLKQYNESQY
ncbi:hypothetical protein BBbe_00320 [Bartonella bovis 91-4]|uniref:Uncharacterized protein n=1 Tax=Bartonella bovis 91-4 TaxID=1094491 RepID=N6VNY6_9HYPH|nr:hypothetical protein BBbe_00320 [Bartonella bovis 91-4]